MKNIYKIGGLSLALLSCVPLVQAERVFTQDDAVVGQAREAISVFDAVTPSKPHRVLVFGRSGGPHRESIPTGQVVLRMLGELTGAYQADFEEDPAVFTAENLKQYDAIAFCNTTGSVLRKTIEYKDFIKYPDEQRKAETAEMDERIQNLLDFVNAGGGFFALHAATDSLRSSKEYLRMIGGEFNHHPWNGNQHVTVRVESPEHPLVAGIFPGTEFGIDDEIYQFAGPYSRDNLRVLMSINIAKSDVPALEMEREDRDYPVAWIRQYGQGRVFYCSLGHRVETYGNPEVLQFWLRGMQFVLGEVDVDMTPVPQPAE